MKKVNQEKGFTLIEVLVGMMVTLILMGAVYVTFVKSSDSYRRAQALADIQERGRFAIAFLQEAIQTADYRGCQQSGVVNNQLVPGYSWNYAVGIQGFDTTEDDDQVVPPAGWANAWAPALDPSFTLLSQGIGDAITVRGSVSASVRLTAPMATIASNLAIPAASDTFARNSIMMVSDCSGRADVFRRTNVPGGGVVAHAQGGGNPGDNSSPNLSAPGYLAGAQLTQVQTTSFHIRDNGRGGNSIYIRRDGGASSLQELIEDVDGMQILYGITTDSTPSANQYLTATQVDAAGVWGSVVSVRIALLIRSANVMDRAPDTRIYNLLGVSYGPYNDLMRRRVYTAVVTLRNRTL